MLFNAKSRHRIASGEITVSYRLWKRAHVKPGKVYATGFGSIAVEAVDVLPAGLISDEAARLAGCEDVDEVRRQAGEHTKTDVRPDTLLHRVQFRFLGDTERPASSVKVLVLPEILIRLERMDVSSERGPWTREFLRLIAGAPRTPARLLAAELSWPLLDFKANVRKLKRLGLTQSFEVGYELTDLGKEVLKN